MRAASTTSATCRRAAAPSRARTGVRVLLLAALLPAGAWASARSDADAARVIEMHVGIPGVAYIGQPLKDFVERFPQAKVTPFARQEDIVQVAVPDAGISCLAVGPTPGEMKVASVGFVLDETYMGAQAVGYRTREGIGQGSTVNDLLGTYGAPTEITGERATKPALGSPRPKEDPNDPKKYQYASPDRSVKTYFVVQGSRVLRVVVNDLAPLDRHMVKRPQAAH